MFTSLRKVKKAKDQEVSDLEKQVAQAIFDLEVYSKDLKADLQPLVFSSAQEVAIGKEKQALIIFVPVRQIKEWRKVHGKVVRELEKKFNGKHVLIVGQRKALTKPSDPTKVHRPRARSLQQVQERFMEDVCYPVEIVGKRTRTRVDGSKLVKLFLDNKDKTNFDHKIKTFNKVCKRLTGKKVSYEFANV
nr:unnamed protein product [Naegleria fowleri]